MDERMVTITVNGQEVEAETGTGLLDVLRRLDLDIPTLCHDDRLTPFGGCRLCVVERKDGRGGMIPACSTPVQRGMAIETETEAVIESRRRNLQLLVLNHRMECPVCERSGDCRFQDLIYLYGVPEEQLLFERIRCPRDEDSPVIVRDPEKCILCGKCVRLCDEVQGVAEIGLISRGLDAVVTTMLDRPLNCEFCGQCVNACPVGALIAKPYVNEIPAWLREHRTTVCSCCSCGCELDAELYEGRIVRVTSSPGGGPNDGTLCAKGWLGWDILSNPERLTRPLVRRNGRLEEASWDEALGVVADAASKARGEGRRIAAIATPRLTNEDALLLRHLVEDGLGSDWVGLGPEAGVRALQEGAGPVLGGAFSTASLQDVKEADLVLVLRGDPGRTHPLLKNVLIRRHRQRELPFALAATFTGGLERHARPFLRLAPGSEPAVVRFLARELAGQGLLDDTVQGYREWEASLESCTGSWAAGVTGVPEEVLGQLAREIGVARKVVVVVVTGRGLPGDEAEAAREAASLVAALGGKAGLLVLGEKANLQGCLHAGLARKSPRELLEAAGTGELGWLYLVGQDPVGAWPRYLAARDALKGSAFVVVQDAFLTDSARAADVVLPAAILIERDGTGIGTDGGVRLYTRIVDPPDGVLQDGVIVRRLAQRMGVGLPSEADIGAAATGLVVREQLRSRLAPVGRMGAAPKAEAFLLDASPQLFHSGSTTARSSRLRELAPGITVRISPADAQAAGLSNGDAVRMVADGREVLLKAGIDHRVAPGTVVAPWQCRRDGASRLVGEGGKVVTVQLRRS
ncbi:MAG: molybdopterin-dependent oxidoreductase [Acidobacteriota bacterium]